MGRRKGSLNKSKVAVQNFVPVELSGIVTEPNEFALSAKRRGRPKGSKNYTTIIPTSVPPVFDVSVRERESYETNLPRKDRLNLLSGRLRNNFMGENYAGALKQAEIWAKRKGYVLLDYYEQSAFGRSVIVSYSLGSGVI